MSFVSTDPHTHQGENIWFTPPELINKLGFLFDMDVCTVSYRPFDIARTNIEYDKGECGLSTHWHGLVWMNPPYGKEIEPFINKFKNHSDGIALVFARMGTPWMQDWVKSGNGIFFLRKRIAFISKDGKKGSNAGADSCFLYRGKLASEIIENSGIEGVFNKQSEG